MIVFAAPLPHTSADALAGLADTVVLRLADEVRGPGATCWVGAPGSEARAGDHVLLPVGAPIAEARSRGLRVWWRCRTPAEVARAAKSGVSAWLCGAEAGGAVGRATALTLIRAVGRLPSPIPWVAEGLTAGARAASLAVGAAGVVLDCQLWSALGSPLHADRARALLRAGARDTRLLGDVDGIGLRVLVGREAVEGLAGRVEREGPAAVGASLGAWWRTAEGPAPAPVSVGELAALQGQSAAEIVREERRRLREHLRTVGAHHPLRAECDPLGTGVPIVQGPMANVAEGRGLADAVRAAGGLPFVALGALRPAEAEAVLDGVDGVSPCGAGLIAFDVAPHRDAHIAALVARGPRPVILAGGSPALALSLARQGLEPWLHTPSPRLAGLAVAAGVPAVVLEGHEAGGHVGPVPSSALWDQGLRAVAERADGDVLVVLAGGIGDATSAAFAAALAAPGVARGIRVALQVGTAFFFTDEIRRSGQLSAAGQDVALQADRTVLVGESVNLPLRCAPNAFAEQARRDERAWREEGLALRERRERVEHKNLGRTRIAAKGLERDPTWDGADPQRRLRAVPEARVRAEGAHTFGQGATVTDALTTVAALVDELTAGARAVLARASRWGTPRAVAGTPTDRRRGPEIKVPLGRIRGGSRVEAPVERAPASGPIAVIGLGCVLPGASDLEAWWRAQVRGVDAIAPIPPDRWDPARYTSPGAGASGPAHSSSIAAAVAADPPFDALRYRIPPRVLPTVERAQRLALLAGDEALVDAGLDPSTFDPARAAVILGNAMGGEWRSKMALRVRFREVLAQLAAAGALPADALAQLEDQVEARLDEEVVPLRPESIVGLLGNLAASRLAAWLDWQGGSHTVDAACAASLLAVVHAVDALRAGRIDLALTGGVDTDLSIDTYVGFSRTQALSSAGSRPFSRDADGFVMGEGAAVFALARLEDAVARGWPVWAVIHGVGTASDGRARGLTAPHPDGQRLAIGRAWEDAGMEPSDAVYVEAHGTGTTLGDRTEAEVLSEVFGTPWVGSVKGAVGHLKSGAGAAGLLRAVLAVATGIVPPTAHTGPPIAEAVGLGIARLPTALSGGVPLAGVSAFGFGGTNAHLVIGAPPKGVRRPELARALTAAAEPFLAPPDAARWTADSAPSPAVLTPSPRVTLFVGESPDAVADAILSGRSARLHGAPGPVRLALVEDPTQAPVDRQAIADALRRGDTLPGAGRTAFLDDQPRPVFVVCPGQGAQTPGAVDSLRRFAPVEDRRHALEAALGGSLEAPADPDTRALHRHVFAVSALWAERLIAAEIPVCGAMGHSLGELAALVVAGCADADTLAPVVRARGEALHAAPAGAMLALLGDPAAAESLAAEHDLSIAGRNGPSATVLSGPPAAIEAARKHARDADLRAIVLDVAHAFHSPDVASAKAPLAAALQDVPLAPGPFHSVTGRADLSVADALVHALTAPVDFAPTLAASAPPDALVVELGPGRTLTGHVRALGLHAIALDPAPERDPHGPVRAAAALWAAGHPGLLDLLPDVDLRQPTTRRPTGPAAFLTPDPLTSRPAQPPPPTPTAATRSTRDSPRHGPHTAETDTRAAVLAALHEITGYDAPILAAAGNLQAELGIDSIQRLEVVGLLQERLDLTLSDADQDALEAADLDALVALIDARRAAPETAPSPSEILAWAHLAERVSLPAPPPRGTPAPAGFSMQDGLAWYVPTATTPEAAVIDLLGALPDAPSASTWLAVVPDDPVGHAVAAALRCLAAERGAAAHALRLSPGAPQPGSLPDLPADHSDTLVYDGTALWRQQWVVTPLGERSRPRVILAAGGLRGIVGPILTALSPERCVVVGRSPADTLKDELAALQRDVPGATYVQADVTSPSDLARAVAALGAPPDLVLHGAAVLRDRRGADLTPEDVHAVFAPRLAGLRALRDAVPDAPIALLSSVAAHAASPGQAAYAAANAACEALSDRVVALTAWADRGMASAPAVRAALRARGVMPLPLDVGADAVARALVLDAPALITTAPVPGAAHPLPWPLRHQQATDHGSERRLRLLPDDPLLVDHRLQGRPLVPAAVWLDLLLHDGPVADFEILGPVFVDRPRDDVRIEQSGPEIRISAGDRVVARASRPAAGPVLAERHGPPADRSATPLYRSDLLFHGPRWQALDQIGSDGNGTLSASLVDACDVPRAIDGAHQLLAVWAARHLGWTGLPVGAGAWAHASARPLTRLAAWPWVDGDEVIADVIGWSGERPVLHGRAVRLRRAAALDEATRVHLATVLSGGGHE